MRTTVRVSISPDSLTSIRKAAQDRTPVCGLTHRFYKYPARFSPQFVASAIEAFSKPGDLVLDPYMGGGTTIVEAIARGRRAIGSDLNSLAVFVATAKTTVLTEIEKQEVSHWANIVVPRMSYHTVTDRIADLICPDRTRNLNLPRARPTKKLLAQSILALSSFRSERARIFARCVLLNVAQWALNGRKVTPSLDHVRARVCFVSNEMLASLAEFADRVSNDSEHSHKPLLLHCCSSDLPRQQPFVEGEKADLVVTSPPYPGIHILYHRWQVDGRKETPAPYWIASCMDGEGSSFYNFADRSDDAEDDYFEESLRTLLSLRRVVRDSALVVQMIAFSKPRSQLERYLGNMEQAGFVEVRGLGTSKDQLFRRIWRHVPNRSWYANLKGRISSSREVVLIHRAA